MAEKSNISQLNTSTSRKTKKVEKAQSNAIREKFLKLLTSFDKSLSNWKHCSLRGNSIITEDILSKKKDIFTRGKFI